MVCTVLCQKDVIDVPAKIEAQDVGKLLVAQFKAYYDATNIYNKKHSESKKHAPGARSAK